MATPLDGQLKLWDAPSMLGSKLGSKLSSQNALPTHLNQNHATGLSPNEPIAQFEIGILKNFVYLLIDWKTRQAAIIDTQKNLSAPLRALEENQLTLSYILLTHTHHDHVAGLPGLIKSHSQVPILVHGGDLHRLEDPIRRGGAIQTLEDEEIIQLGSLEIRALHTPGHSAGELSYFVRAGERNYLFTGDTIFIRDCGRTDLGTGSNDEMFATIQRIKKLPPDTVFLPGHHYKPECATTLETELKVSPPFQCRSVQELEALP